MVLTITDPTNPNPDPAALDKITLKNKALEPQYWIENFQFADGTVLHAADINQQAMTGTAGDDVLSGFMGLGLTYQAGDGSDTINAQSGNDVINGGDGNDTVTDTGGSNVIDGGTGNDSITAAGNNTITGGDGNDAITIAGQTMLAIPVAGQGLNVIDGGAGNDSITITPTVYTTMSAIQYSTETIRGGLGNDTISGSAEADTYLFSRGDGQDVVSDDSSMKYTQYVGAPSWTTFDADSGQADTIRFEAGIVAADVSAKRVGNDMVLTITDPTNPNPDPAALDKITLKNWALGPQNWIENFQFADGTVLHAADINQQAMTGTAGDDVLSGFMGLGLTYQAGDGSDTINAQSGNDVINGGDGNDTVTDTGGSNVIDGGTGNDSITAAGNNTITGGDGNDAITIAGQTMWAIPVAGQGVNVIDGGAGNDRITITPTVYTTMSAIQYSTETIRGGLGNDTISGSAEADTYLFSRGDGQDVVSDDSSMKYTQYVGAPSWTTFDADSGQADTIRFEAGIEAADVSAKRVGNDMVLTITDPTNPNPDPAALDKITLKNWALGPQYWIENFQFADGTVLHAADINQQAMPGTAGDDVLTLWDDTRFAAGQGGNDIITGNSADNVLDGGHGADTLGGGAGNDTYIVDNAGDVVTENANEGTDTVQASVTYTLGPNVENLSLTGTAALNGTGNSLNNVLPGNGADNVLDGAAGADTLIGGDGNDTYVVDNSGDVVTENANEGSDTVQSSIAYTLSANLENLVLTGTTAINGTGNALDNLLTGNSAANTLNGSAGNDTLDGGVGADTMIGGTGNDTYIVDNSSDVVTENAGEGTDTVQASVSYTLAANVENLVLTGTAAINGSGNALDNIITGNSADNILDGGTGNDTMNGGAGNDTYIVDNSGDAVTENANEGTDTVQSAVTYTLGANLEHMTLTGTAEINGSGNALNNVLTGNSGDNTFDGAAGADTMIGGAGNDTYLVDNGSDVVTEKLNEGNETVQSSITYILGANVENLTLTGTAAINGSGNALDNVLTGNSADNTLDGGIGADTMIAGASNDIYVVDTAA